MKTDDEKHLNEIIDEYKSLVDGPADDLQRRQLNYDTRFCVWAGQSPDLKKHKSRAPDCKEPVPWEGATDSRIYLVDQMINEDVDMLCVAYKQATPEAKPVALDDVGKARRTSQFLQWLWSSQLDDVDAEAEILANGMLEDGIAYISVIWDRRVELVDQDFSLEQIAQAAQAAQFQLAQGVQDPNLALVIALPQTIMDPERDDDTVELVKAIYRQQSERTGDFYETEIPEPATDEVRKGIKELRETGSTTIAVPRLTANKPCVTALRDRIDLFLPDDTQRLQDARRIYHREFVTAETLDSRALTMGYDQDWVDEVKDRGKGLTTTTGSGVEERYSLSGGNARSVGEPYICLDELYEIVHCYERKSNERGVPGI